ncbi:beta-lactamase/transpeptidase-like protein [Penicillium brevicompactum]|uniref:Beta-lactamase/transpeptidase-like protein n=1 Tax=Penicillium brevicompactum TaxID=5074 RepID=A0A9W9ULV4_PENBR|nr:beta-lactamase/transpeptidase-like protein [Penicillium brevicompactum]
MVKISKSIGPHILWEPGWLQSSSSISAWQFVGYADYQKVEIKSGMSLDQFMKSSIWSKLGAESTTFHPDAHLDALPAPLEMGNRQSVGEGTKSVTRGKITLQKPSRDDLGGIGLFSTPSNYMKLLSALLCGGCPLLNEASVDTLFRPQLSDASRLAMPKGLGTQMRRVLGIQSSDTSSQADHCLAGTIAMEDIPGRRKAGTVNWSGLPNLHWWIDRKTGIAAGLFTQLLPPGDSAVTSLLIDLEVALYKYINNGEASKL